MTLHLPSVREWLADVIDPTRALERASDMRCAEEMRRELYRLNKLATSLAHANADLTISAAAADVWIEAAREIVQRVEGEERVRMIEGGGSL